MINHNYDLPKDAIIVDRQQELKDVFTLTLAFSDPEIHAQYQFSPGQFNMLYLYGIGEVAISIISSPEDDQKHLHTIRAVGKVTNGLAQLKVGDHIGIRGPFGRGWPLDYAKNKDVLILTGGLGCAPSVSIINYILNNRSDFNTLHIIQGVKHSNDFIFKAQYDEWAKSFDTHVHLAADVSTSNWPWYTGLVTGLLDQITFDSDNTVCMMCGPEAMLKAAAKKLISLQVPENEIFLNLERNMECALGHCGHCQFGGHFICKDGPVFCYPDIKGLLGKKGF